MEENNEEIYDATQVLIKHLHNHPTACGLKVWPDKIIAGLEQIASYAKEYINNPE